MTHTLETERLILRKPKACDWDGFKTFAMSDRAIGIGGPHNLGKAWRSFAAEIGHWDMLGYGMFAVTQKGDDTAIGLVGPWAPADWPENELAWMVWGNVEGKSVAYEAATATRDFVFHTLGWETAVSYVDEGLDRSAALAVRLGAHLDPNAKSPVGKPSLVYRHPKPEALQ
jgi:RimJ/RimL family protein N-acetyltransferase